MRPKVYIVIDTGIIGGPGRGLFQFFKHADPNKYGYLLSNFDYPNPNSTEFSDTAKELRLNFTPLRQPNRFSLAPLGQALKLYRSEGCNIVQSHGYKSHVVGATIKLITGARWIAFSHGWTTENLKVRLYHLLDRFLLRWADVVIAVSPPLYTSLSEIRGPRKPTKLLLNAVDGEAISGAKGGTEIRRELGIADTTLLLGCFGRLSTEKGQDILVRALAKPDLKDADLRLLILGNGPEKEHLVELVKSLDLQGKISFLPYQGNMRDYYEAIDLLVIPSRSEGLPNVLLEAMYFSKPALATDVGAIQEVITSGTTGWIIPPEQVDALSEELTKVLSARNTIRAIGSAAKNSLTPRFDPGARAKKIVEIYETAVLNDKLQRSEVRL